MTSRDFAYWLQGLFELSDVQKLDEKQTDLIKRHLSMVFYHEIDPSMGDKKKQHTLSELHSGGKIDTSITTGIDQMIRFNC